MFAYIVRRLLWAVVLLIVLSMVTFGIFYLIPRLGGATPETLATRYVGRAATAERSEERRVGKECPQLCRSRWSPYH